MIHKTNFEHCIKILNIKKYLEKKVEKLVIIKVTQWK